MRANPGIQTLHAVALTHMLKQSSVLAMQTLVNSALRLRGWAGRMFSDTGATIR